MITPLAIINIVFGIIIFVIIIAIGNTASKFRWAFGDGPEQERLSYKFMRLLVAGVLIGLIAAVVNILLI